MRNKRRKEQYTLYATKIKMKYGCRNSQDPMEIDQIYIYNYGWYKKELLHDYLKTAPKTIVVNISPYPYLIPMVSINREKYVRSNPDIYKHDNLLDLPRA